MPAVTEPIVTRGYWTWVYSCGHQIMRRTKAGQVPRTQTIEKPHPCAYCTEKGARS